MSLLLEKFATLDHTLQALLATLFTWFVTALGAAMVFFFKTINRRVLDSMLGFAAGVMIAASYWSLLAPAIEMAEAAGEPPWRAPLIGFLIGGLFLYLADKLLPHLHVLPSGPDSAVENVHEGPTSRLRRSILLVLAVTLHNIPEGLAVGVAFGALAAELPGATLGGAIALAIGIGLQNFPEGAAVSVPLRRENLSRRRAFFYGQASGIVEPIAGVVGAMAVLHMRPILPYALAFAAGAMIYVVVEELIPEAQQSRDSDMATIGAMLGFAVMMTLDVALG